MLAGGGDDYLSGGGGADRYEAGDGADQLDLYDWGGPAADVVTCGGSRDQIMNEDPLDQIDPSCEDTFGDPWETPRCGEFSCLVFQTLGTFQARQRRVVVPATCSRPDGCAGTLKLTLKGRTLAKRTVEMPAGRSKLRVRLSRRSAKWIPRRGGLVVRATLGKVSRAVRLKRR